MCLCHSHLHVMLMGFLMIDYPQYHVKSQNNDRLVCDRASVPRSFSPTFILLAWSWGNAHSSSCLKLRLGVSGSCAFF